MVAIRASNKRMPRNSATDLGTLIITTDIIMGGGKLLLSFQMVTCAADCATKSTRAASTIAKSVNAARTIRKTTRKQTNDIVAKEQRDR